MNGVATAYVVENEVGDERLVVFAIEVVHGAVAEDGVASSVVVVVDVGLAGAAGKEVAGAAALAVLGHEAEVGFEVVGEVAAQIAVLQLVHQMVDVLVVVFEEGAVGEVHETVVPASVVLEHLAEAAAATGGFAGWVAIGLLAPEIVAATEVGPGFETAAEVEDRIEAGDVVGHLVEA